MHLVTGVIIAALAGRLKENKALQGMPMLRTGPLQVAHVLPGRIRFIVPALKDDPPRFADGLTRLKSAAGIDEVSYSTVSGSVLVRFDRDIVDPPLLFSAVARLLGLERELERPVVAALLKEAREIGGSLNRTVYDETRGLVDLQTIAIVALLIYGGRKLVTDRWAAVPNGLTLIWWAVNMMYRGRGALHEGVV